MEQVKEEALYESRVKGFPGARTPRESGVRGNQEYLSVATETTICEASAMIRYVCSKS